MKKPNDLPKKYVACFNQFVIAANKHNILFESLNVSIGENYEGKEGLHFQIETSNGLTKEECESVFGEFISRYPECGIDYNIRERSALEQVLINGGATVMELRSGFKLSPIES